MGKRKSSESGAAEPRKKDKGKSKLKEEKKQKKEKKDDPAQDRKQKEKKQKVEKEEKVDKKEKKEKKEKKKEKVREKESQKEMRVEISEAKPKVEAPRHIGPQGFPPEVLAQKEKKLKKERKVRLDKSSMAGPAAVREVMLCSANASNDKSRPFGLELDGALVVDLADEGAAIPAGVQIGWRVLEVNGKSVEDEEGKAAKVLREAEEKMANRSGKASVSVSFLTEEPEHWKQAAKTLSRGH